MDTPPRPLGHPRISTVFAAMLVVCGLLSASLLPATAKASSPGQVNILRNATSSFDSYTTGATATQQQWIRAHYWRMRGYAPYFDRALGWAPSTDFYRDLYAIYADESTLISEHPSWVLKDGSGQRLYIPWGCNGSGCTQYAADIGNPGFRQFWINEAKSDVEKGYKGIFIDDVNLEMKVGNASGTFTRPIDPRTGQLMADADWRRYMAEFTEEIRAQIPNAYITHNTAWWMEQSDPYVQREIASANALELERGFNDGGLTGGTGKYGFRTLLSHIDWLHSLGKSVILEPRLSNATQREFELASYYLVSNGSDSLCTDNETDPNNWWSGWETKLGANLGERYEWNGLLRRDFENGFVLVNPPGGATVTASLTGSYTKLSGGSVSSVTLSARQGQILLGAVTSHPATEPAPEKPAEAESIAPATPVPPAEESDGGSVEVTGEVTAPAPTPVTIKVKRHGSKHWQVARIATIRTTRAGKFRRKFRGLPTGHYRVIALATGHPGRRAIVQQHKRFAVR